MEQSIHLWFQSRLHHLLRNSVPKQLVCPVFSPHRRLSVSPKFDEDQGHIVSERTVSPLSDAVKNGLLHIGNGFLC